MNRVVDIAPLPACSVDVDSIDPIIILVLPTTSDLTSSNVNPYNDRFGIIKAGTRRCVNELLGK
jgi:hypothetical protein